MNPKFIITSITGIGLLGGVVTGCYYFCGQKTSEKQKKTPNNEKSATKVVNTQNSQAVRTKNPPNQPSTVSADSPQPNKVVTQPLQGQETARASLGAGEPALPVTS